VGTFSGLEGVPDVVLPRQLRWPKVFLGHRRCPNTRCNTHVFFALQRDELIAVYPAESLGFDSAGIPPAVASALKEAITCHANGCYRAAAMLVRRCLEALCHEHGIVGKNLKTRIDNLDNRVRLSAELLEGLHHLRLLGNDAAHTESQDYSEVGKEEVELAISITKAVLQIVYQHTALTEKLKARKKVQGS
jgi:hypothetical protein